MVGDGHSVQYLETSVPFESSEAAVSIVADGPISDGCCCHNDEECMIPGLVDNDTSSGEEDCDYNSDSDSENEDEEIWYDAIKGYKCRWQENENIVSAESNDTGGENDEKSDAHDEFTDEGEY